MCVLYLYIYLYNIIYNAFPCGTLPPHHHLLQFRFPKRIPIHFPFYLFYFIFFFIFYFILNSLFLSPVCYKLCASSALWIPNSFFFSFITIVFNEPHSILMEVQYQQVYYISTLFTSLSSCLLPSYVFFFLQRFCRDLKI